MRTRVKDSDSSQTRVAFFETLNSTLTLNESPPQRLVTGLDSNGKTLDSTLTLNEDPPKRLVTRLDSK